MDFEIVDESPGDFGAGPRLGRLRLRRGGVVLDTPHYVALTSRGVVPHLAQDNLIQETGVRGLYTALEDFVERDPAPILSSDKTTCSSILRDFIAASDDHLLILGPRRSPAVPCPSSNSDSTMSVLTSVGLKKLAVEDCLETARRLGPDIVIGLSDLPQGTEIGRRRIEKMILRSESWAKELFGLVEADPSWPFVFMPLLPIDVDQQTSYLDVLEEHREMLHGLVLYASQDLSSIPAELKPRPRLTLTQLSSPHELLRDIMLGADLITAPFVNEATDAGITLDFEFPPPQLSTAPDRLSLGTDMWEACFATDLAPLSKVCDCYTCRNHHKAYIRHLLSAQEMLAWTLLQIHNLAVMDRFFAGIRESMHSKTFDSALERFTRAYEPRLPEKSGQGPRLRGYQFRSEGPNMKKKNKPAHRMLNDRSLKSEEAPEPLGTAQDLEESGFAEPLT